MNEMEKVLNLFETADDWNSFVELSNMKDMIRIEWRHWSWYKRGAGIWINHPEIIPEKFIGNVNANADLKGFLTANGFHESRENAWYPFMKTIPAKVFFQNVNNDSCKLVEECLFRAKQDAKGLADDLWEEVFKPFVEKEDAISMLVEDLQ